MKENRAFTILKSDATNGDGGYGAGVLDLNHVTPLIIDCATGNVSIDMEALHGRSQIEKKVRFSHDLAHATDAYDRYWIVWLVLQRGANGPYYYGCSASEVRIAKAERRIRLGYKSLPEQVNFLDKALKGHCIVHHLDAASRRQLAHFCMQYNEAYWQHTPDTFKQHFPEVL